MPFPFNNPGHAEPVEVRTLPGGDALPADRDALRDWPDILEAAEAALARRREAYPAMVEKGGMTGEEAEADIAAWNLLAAEWRFIVHGTGELPPSYTLFARIAAVDLAIERACNARSRRSRDAGLARQQDLYTAMRWHLSRLDAGGQLIHRLARLTHQMRGAMAHCAICDRRREDAARTACTRTDCGLPHRFTQPPSRQEKEAA